MEKEENNYMREEGGIGERKWGRKKHISEKYEKKEKSEMRRIRKYFIKDNCTREREGTI